MFPAAFTTPRTYLRVQLSDDPLQPMDVARSLTRLHQTDARDDATTPTYEWLFAATGDTSPDGDRHLKWYVGTDGSRDLLRRALRQSLPALTALVETDASYQAALDLPGGVGDERTVAGVEWQGAGDRPADWQCPLPALEMFAGSDGAGDWPLADLLDALATTDAPALVQLLLRPKPDWTTTKEERCVDLELNSDLRRHAIGHTLVGQTRNADHNSPNNH